MQKARKGAWTTKKKLPKKIKNCQLNFAPEKKEGRNKGKKEGRREGGRNEGRKKGKGKKKLNIFFDAFEQLDLP